MGTNLQNLSNVQLLPILSILDVDDLINACQSNVRINNICVSDPDLANKINKFRAIEAESSSLDQQEKINLLKKYIREDNLFNVDYLLNHGLPFNSTDMQLAIQNCKINIVEYFITNYGSSFSPILINSVITLATMATGERIISDRPIPQINTIKPRSCYTDILKLLIKSFPDYDLDLDQLLFKAVLYNNVDGVEYLLSKGANPNSDNGRIIYTAAMTTNKDNIKMLLERGANSNVIVEPRNDPTKPKTPLGAILNRVKRDLLYHPGRDHTHVSLNGIRLLLQYGADPHLNNDEAIKLVREIDNPQINDIFRNYL